MLHEIQDGDMLIVTLPTMPRLDDPIKDMIHQKRIFGEADGVQGLTVYCPNATETSVHVIRAKDTPKPDWPAWRDGMTEKPPIGSNVLYWSPANKEAYVHYGVGPEDVFNTHWMPLPEGPKS